MTRHDAQNQVLAALPSIPRDEDGPVFREPWEAQAFAMTVQLHAKGVFTWPQWAEALGKEIARAGADDTGEDYYLHWMAALEKLTQANGVVSHSEFSARKDAWDRAARATPHGEPIELGREQREHAAHGQSQPRAQTE